MATRGDRWSRPVTRPADVRPHAGTTPTTQVPGPRPMSSAPPSILYRRRRPLDPLSEEAPGPLRRPVDGSGRAAKDLRDAAARAKASSSYGESLRTPQPSRSAAPALRGIVPVDEKLRNRKTRLFSDTQGSGGSLDCIIIYITFHGSLVKRLPWLGKEGWMRAVLCTPCNCRHALRADETNVWWLWPSST